MTDESEVVVRVVREDFTSVVEVVAFEGPFATVVLVEDPFAMVVFDGPFATVVFVESPLGV